ncbi:hypothetical protein REPUB_Repub02eG0000200 [Reevesia pubescens]
MLWIPPIPVHGDGAYAGWFSDDCWSASSRNSEDDKVVAFQDIKPAAFRDLQRRKKKHRDAPQSNQCRVDIKRLYFYICCWVFINLKQVVSASTTSQLRLMMCSSSALPQPITEA